MSAAAATSAYLALQKVRQAEVAMQRACFVLGIPLALVQPMIDEKYAQAWQQYQQVRPSSAAA